MSHSSAESRQRIRRLSRDALREHQLGRLNELLAAILPANEFYRDKLADCPVPLASLEQLAVLPLTTKEELAGDAAHQPLPANLTWEPDRYTRYHQTSGTRGRPMPVLDTADDWSWWIECWQYVLDIAEITASDRALLAFSFGPFIGFWSANDALLARGARVIPSGGMNSVARLDLLNRTGATALFCTPTYALRLIEVASEHNINLADSSVTKIVVAGETGGSIASTRERIEQAWDARVIDHAGASEVGAWGYADADGRGLRVIESEFIAEFHSVETGQPATDGELSHLVITTLGRSGLPVIRYRTGDLVRPRWLEDNTDRFVLVEGGVLGRADDMLVIRGVNIFSSSVEQILRSFPEVVEFRLTAKKRGAMDELVVEVEDHLQRPERIREELLVRLGLKVDVQLVPAMSLPRFEGKGHRFVDNRADIQP